MLLSSWPIEQPAASFDSRCPCPEVKAQRSWYSIDFRISHLLRSLQVAIRSNEIQFQEVITILCNPRCQTPIRETHSAGASYLGDIFNCRNLNENATRAAIYMVKCRNVALNVVSRATRQGFRTAVQIARSCQCKILKLRPVRFDSSEGGRATVCRKAQLIGSCFLLFSFSKEK